MTTITPMKDEQPASREAGVAEEIRRAVTALNIQIERATDLGLRVELDIFPLQRVTQQWARPVLSATVTKSI